MQSLDAPASSLSLSQAISDIRFGGQEPGSLMHRHCRVLTQKLTFSPAYYYEVGTSVKALKCYIFFSWFIAVIFTDQSVYFYISNCSWNCTSPPNPR